MHGVKVVPEKHQRQQRHRHPLDKVEYYLEARVSPMDISAFRDATTSMVRYAPHPRDALVYAKFFMAQISPPLRNEHSELCILTALIYVYVNSKEMEYLERGVDSIELGLERGLLIRSTHMNVNQLFLREGFERTSGIFSTVARKILKRNKLKASEDRSSMVPFV
ncbi:hypothetical protein BDA99DRAFT_568034 [Phascolomyces articulosus]|uniref:Uncharacterized protein n=1 Tax=Phascolomyces articulosus TaxID=60185 RepID=A0AAD5KB72_9FUNG|nr:hypothetical protein BDA99DRAFT_568034 [Phascolomyces articulosus]